MQVHPALQLAQVAEQAQGPDLLALQQDRLLHHQAGGAPLGRLGLRVRRTAGRLVGPDVRSEEGAVPS